MLSVKSQKHFLENVALNIQLFSGRQKKKKKCKVTKSIFFPNLKGKVNMWQKYSPRGSFHIYGTGKYYK
jgi:hypothetical protein